MNRLIDRKHNQGPSIANRIKITENLIKALSVKTIKIAKYDIKDALNFNVICRKGQELTDEIIEKNQIKNYERLVDIKNKRNILCDSEQIGLRIRKNVNGSLSWLYETKIKGKKARSVFGKYSKDGMNVKAARNYVKKILSKQINPFQLNSETTLLQLFQSWFDNRVAIGNKYKPKGVDTIKSASKVWVFLEPDQYQIKLRKFIANISNYRLLNIKDKKITEITKDVLIKYHACITQRSPSAADRILDILRTVFNYAVEKKLLNSNPVKFSKEEKNPKIRRIDSIEVYKKHEIDLLKNTCQNLSKTNPVGAMAILLLITTGLRKSNACSLRWNQVSDDFSEIKLLPTDTKNKKFYSISLFSEAVDVLKFMKGHAQPDNKYVFPSNAACGYFYNPKRLWKKITIEAGVPYKCLHLLRHSFASWLLVTTGNIKFVADYLGWSTTKVAEIYAMINKDEQLKIVRDLSAKFKQQDLYLVSTPKLQSRRHA